MPSVIPERLRSHRMQFLAALLLLLFLAAGAMRLIHVSFSRRAVDLQAEMLARQGGFRVEALLRDLVMEAHAQGALLRELLAAQTGERPEFTQVLRGIAPTFASRPLLTYAGLAREENGEYAMLERVTPEEIRLWHYTVRPEGVREIRNYLVDRLGRLTLAEVRPWTDYDPRQRPFYLLARESREPVWTDSYMFFPYRLRPNVLGVTLAEAWRDSDGRLLGVLDTDFDTQALSGFLSELQHRFDLTALLVERRRDGTRRVVAHSAPVGPKPLSGPESELVADPLAAECLRQLASDPRNGGSGQTPLRFVHAGTEYVGIVNSLTGEFPHWDVVVLVPRPVVASGFAAMNAAMALALTGVVIVGILVATWLARQVTRPLVKLAEDVGNLTDTGEGVVREEGPPEVLRLARRFNDLVWRIRTRRAELVRTEAAAREQAERLKRTNEAVQQAANIVADYASDNGACGRHLVRMCCEALQVSRASLWQRQPGADEVQMLTMYDAASGRYLEGLVLKASEYPDYWEALQRDRRVVVDDAASDPRTQKLYAERLHHLGRVAILDVAIQSRKEIVGIFSFHLLELRRPWTAEDDLLVRAVANLVALTFERSGRLGAERAVLAQAGRLTMQNAALVEITHLLGEDMEFDLSLRRIDEISAMALDLTAASIWRLDESTGISRLVDQYHAPTKAHRSGVELPRNAYPRLRARFAARRCVAVPDVAADPDYADYYRDHLSHLGFVALLQSAVRSRGRIIGLVAFQSTNPGRSWTPEDELFAGAVADVLALHLESEARGEAEAKIKQRSERLERQELALSQAARSLALREGLLEPAFRELSQLGTDGLGVDRTSLWLIRTLEQQLQLIDLYDKKHGEHSGGQTVGLLSVPVYFQAMQQDRFLVADEVKNDPRLVELVAGQLAPPGIGSLLEAGIFSRGERVGFVRFEQMGPGRHWEKEEEIFAGAVADLAALALEATARRTAEEEMERSRERLRLHIEGMPLAAIDWDQKVTIIGWNPAAEHIYGYGRNEVLGRDGHFLIPAAEQARMADVWRELALGRSNYIARATNLTKNGQIIYCDWHNTVLRDGHGRMIGVTSMVEDVTGRVQAETEIRQLNANLEHRVAERTAALEAANEKLHELDRLKSEFLATMSHELRTPLNSIIGFTGIIKEGLAGPVNAEQRKQLDMVFSSGKHLLGLINDILDLSRVEAGRLQLEFTEFTPAEVLSEAINTLMPMVRMKQLACVVEEADPALRIVCDRKRFFQIVVNLVNNAVKFTDQGGVQVSMHREGDRLRVRVIDTGPGIRAENMGGLFEAFRQMDGSARRVYEGTGLGLYLCRKLLRLLGGEIGVESEWGHGAHFWFWVPLAGAPASGSTPPMLQPPATP